jgi:hypothetical protein
MKGRRIAVLALTVFSSACASSKPESSEIRFVHDRESLAGCTKVGIIPFGSASAGPTNFSGGLSPQLQAQVTSLGGNVAFGGEGRHPYIEVWSCPVETVVVPR